jgi:Domain of unknown function (DUF4129)
LKHFLIFFLLQVISCVAYSQAADSLTDQHNGDEVFAEEADSYAIPDTSRIVGRIVDEGTLHDLKTDPALQYKESPTIAESLWDRFRLWLGQLIQAIFQNAVTTDWGRVFMYIVGIILLIVLIMMLLKVNAFRVFYSGQGANTFSYTALDENIHEMDFEKLIQEATGKNDYRLGIRLIFLYALKMLSDKNLIHWDQGKTNHDYLNELYSSDIKAGFNELNSYFEHAWYGNFRINPETFSRVEQIFSEWRGKLK